MASYSSYLKTYHKDVLTVLFCLSKRNSVLKRSIVQFIYQTKDYFLR